MAITTLTWLYLASSSISAVINLLMFFLLFANFLRRKTIGTILLSFSFLVTAIGETMFSATFWIQAFSTTIPSVYSGSIYFIGMAVLSLNTYFYYMFANRYMIRDNDLSKSLVALTFCLSIGITLGLGMYYIIQGIGTSPGIVIFGPLEGTNLTMYIIGYYLAIPIVPTSVFVIFTRITVKGINMIRHSNDVISKKGLSYVITASILHIIGAASRTIGFWFPSVRNLPILSIILFSSGVVITFIALLLYYLGWVMPDWLKRRFREQAWFTKIYIGKIEEPTDKKTKTTSFTTDNFVEITEN